jgi:NAD(P)-dependent dehydrogenase (short-subunit alcohol dehydrogenase family)
MQIQGRSAIVTGGASGLGAATVALLAERGMHVVAFDRQDWAGTPVAGAHLVHGDVTDAADVAQAIEVATSMAPLGVVVNCAGVGSAQRVAARSGSGQIRFADAEAFRRVVDINLMGTFHLVSQGAAAIADGFVADPPAGDDGIDSIGVIVNTASIAAFEGQVGQAAYAASKAAVVALTFTAARDLAPLRIRVNAIAPGLIETPLISTIRDDVKGGLVDAVVHPRRSGRPAEFASLALHLVDNEYINGEVIRLDGASRLPFAPEAARL